MENSLNSADILLVCLFVWPLFHKSLLLAFIVLVINYICEIDLFEFPVDVDLQRL